MSAGLKDSLIPKNWSYFLSKLIYTPSLQNLSSTQKKKKKEKKVIIRMKCLISMSVEGNTTTYFASNTTLNIESRMFCTTYKKQSYLNNFPPPGLPPSGPNLILWFSLKRVIWQHFSPFMGKKKRRKEVSSWAGLQCHMNKAAQSCAAPLASLPQCFMDRYSQRGTLWISFHLMHI